MRQTGAGGNLFIRKNKRCPNFFGHRFSLSKSPKHSHFRYNKRDGLYERLGLYYCHDNGRPGTDIPVKMVLIFVTCWDSVFAMVSYSFCKRFPEALTGEIFEHILNKAFNNRTIDPSTIFIDALISKPVQSRKSSGRNRSQKRRRCIPGSCAERATRKERGWARSR